MLDHRLAPSETVSQRESWNAILADLKLRISELYGDLSDKIFYALLKKDLDKIFKSIPQIPSEFNYIQELKNLAIRSSEEKLSSDKRKQASLELKKNYLSQNEALAHCRITIERLIAHSPDISKDKIDEMLFIFAKRYGIPKAKLDEYLSITEKFDQNRANIKLIRETYPDDSELATALLGEGIQLPEKFKIKITPYNILIYTSAEDIKRLYGDKNSNVAGYALTKIIFLPNSRTTLQIPYNVVPFPNFKNKYITQHEVEHTKNWLVMSPRIPMSVTFDPVIIANRFNYINSSIEKLSNLLVQSDVSKSNQALFDELEGFYKFKSESTAYFEEMASSISRTCLNNSLESARDEIIAMKKDGRSNYFEILGRDPIYKFQMGKLSDLKIYLRAAQLHDALREVEGIERTFYNVISDAVSSFDALVILGKFNRDEAVALLASTPILSWPTKVRDLIKIKNNKN